MSVIKFLTKREDHDPLIYKSPKYQVLDNVTELDAYFQLAKKFGRTAFDTEFNDGRLFENELLLASIGEADNTFVIDMTSMLREFREVFNDNSKDIRMIGHNLQADKSVCSWHGIEFHRHWDTMVAEQRLNMGLGVSNSLEKTYERRLKKFMPEDKEIRKEFSQMTLSSKFLPKHISYSGGDVRDTVRIAEIQKQLLHERNQLSFYLNIECELVDILTEMLLEGLYIDEEKWARMILDRQKKKLVAENLMDKEVARLTNKTYKERKKGEYVMLDLFGEHKEFENLNKKKLNYGSPKQIFKVFEELNLPIPTYKDKGKVSNSTKEEALQQYLLDNPFTPLRTMIEHLIEYRGHQKLISSYGKKFIRTEIRKKNKKEYGYKNPHTGKVHTNYKQCFLPTGRLSSGDSKKGLYNSQQVPGEADIREAFTLSKQEIDEGWYFSTLDLTGAELIIMAALAGDMHLYNLGADKIIDGKLVEGDLHSPIATKCWQNVYDYRMSLGRDLTIIDTKGKKYTLTKDFLINKQNNKQLRTDFKPMTFGVVYGLQANKGAQTLNILKDESQIIIDTIVKEIPLTIKMVEAAVKEALSNGYVIFNKKSNNRRWFPEILNVLNYVRDKPADYRYQVVKNTLDFSTLSSIEGEARNCRIQGTQADMIKEIKVNVRNLALKEKVPMKLALTVHDELGVKHKDKDFGKLVAEEMKRTANSYLEFYSKEIKMNVDYKTLTNWIK